MTEEEILHYAKIFSNAIGDVHKLEIYQGAEKKTIAEPELWGMVIDLLSKKDKVIQETIKYLETYPYVAYTLNGDILHNSENAIKILKGEEIDEHLEGDIW